MLNPPAMSIYRHTQVGTFTIITLAARGCPDRRHRRACAAWRVW
jgi:hypothetical protein